MKKIITTYIMLLIAITATQAQLTSSPFPGVEVTNPEAIEIGIKAVTQSKFIFEGTVIGQEYYKSPTDKNMYTINIVKIHKIFKGQDDLSCGTVSLLTRGGIDPADAEKRLKDLPSHSEYYKKRRTGIFFCVPNDAFYKEAAPTITTDNTQLLRTTLPMYGTSINYLKEITDIYSIEEINGAAEGLLGIKFKSLSDLYAYIQQVYALSLNNYMDCDASQALKIPLDNTGKVILKPAPQRVLNTTYGSVVRQNKSQIYLNHLQNLLPTIKKHIGRDNGTLQYTIENETITGNGPKYLEFDVMMLASGTGTYLDNAPIYLTYNTQAFGDSVFTRGNITLSNGSLLTSPTYLDPMVYSGDIAPDTLLIAIGTDFLVTNKTRVEVPSGIAAPIAHVKMAIQNCGIYSEIFFVKQATMNIFTLHTITANAASPTFSYDNVITTGSLNDKTCVPVIDNITSASAGTDENITIIGKYFGTTRGTGQVMTKNAQYGGASFIRRQDPSDYVSWSDHEIVMKATSINYLDSMNGVIGVVGSGKIWVMTDRGDSAISTQDLYVPFAISNTLSSFSQPKIPILLADHEPTIPENRIYHCDTSIGNYPDRKACVQKAIDIWNCRTGVNWLLGSDTTRIVPSASDGISFIFLNKTQHGAPIAFTNYYRLSDCASQNHSIYMGEADISLSIDFTDGNPWFFDASGTLDKPANSYDFLRTLLHELGHAHSLDHNNDIDDLMFHGQNPTPLVPANDRRDKLVHWVTAIDAGNWVINKSLAINWAACGYSNFVRSYPTNCSAINGIKDVVVEKNSFSIFPNPTTATSVNIKLNVSANQSVNMAIYDITGKIVSTQENIFVASGDNYLGVGITNLSQGAYFVKVSNNQLSASQKLIIQ